MQLKEFIMLIKEEDEKLRSHYANFNDNEKRILARTVKLTEELGELCDEVLSFNSLQRKDKLEKHSVDSLSDEFADVIITTLLLAEAMEVDVEKAIKIKIEKLHERHNK